MRKSSQREHASVSWVKKNILAKIAGNTSSADFFRGIHLMLGLSLSNVLIGKGAGSFSDSNVRLFCDLKEGKGVIELWKLGNEF
jgi:hypothetical protein